MSSRAGEAVSRRRRDLPVLFSSFHLFLSFCFLLVYVLGENLPKNPIFFSHVTYLSDNFSNKHLCNEERFLLLPSLGLIQISFEIQSLNPASSPPHRFSLMARVSLGPSDALPSVGTSTAHDECQNWQLISLASSPAIISGLHGGGGSELSFTTSTNLGFGWMGLFSSCGPITLHWPMCKSSKKAQTSYTSQALYKDAAPSTFLLNPRSAPYKALSSFDLKTCYLIKKGRGRLSISVTKFLDETCFKSRNLLDRVTRVSPDASLILRPFGIEFLSNHRWCDLDHAPFCQCISRKTFPLSNLTISPQV